MKASRWREYIVKWEYILCSNTITKEEAFIKKGLIIHIGSEDKTRKGSKKQNSYN